MGGSINVQSTFGEGSIFMVTIPQRIGKMSKPLTEEELLNTAQIMLDANKNIEIYSKQLNYFKKIIKLFKFFNTEFDIDYDQLSDVDLRNLHYLMSLYDGVFPKNVRELQKYYININKYKFIFVLVFNGNKIYNFYSQEMIDNTLCVMICDGKEIQTGIYSNLLPEEYLKVNNFNEKIILKSFKNIEITDEVLDSINILMLSFLKSYDQCNDRKYLNLADKLSQIICKNRVNDIDLIKI